MAEVSDATVELVRIMKQWMSEKPGRNKMSIHQQSKVPYTTICRLINLSSESFFETQTSILTSIAPEQVNEFMEKFHPTLYSAFSSKTQLHPSLKGPQYFLSNRIHCEIIALLYCSEGIPKGELFEIYGEKASEFMSKLEDEQLLEEVDDRIRLINRSNHDTKFMGEMIKSSMDGFEEIAEITDKYTVAYGADGISLNGFKNNQKIISEFWSRMENNLKENPGPYRFETGLLFKPINTNQARSIENEEEK